jgi:hypothetical protein
MIIHLYLRVCLCSSCSSICILGSVSADCDHPFVPKGLSLQVMIIHLYLRVCLCRSWSSICTWGSVSADHGHPFVPEGLCLQIRVIHLYLSVCLCRSWSSICTWGSVSADHDNSYLQSLSYVYVVEWCNRPCTFFVTDLFLLGCDAVLSVCRLCCSLRYRN